VANFDEDTNTNLLNEFPGEVPRVEWCGDQNLCLTPDCDVMIRGAEVT
jgi:hypothetical protein